MIPAIRWMVLLALWTAAPAAGAEPPPLPDLYDQIRPSVVRVLVRGGSGSGFAVEGGQIATAWHVVSGGREMMVETTTGQLVPVRVVAFDREDDVALLEPEAPLEGIVPLPLSERELRVGEPVLAVGHPLIFGQGPEGKRKGLLAWSLTEGVVSSLSEGFVQTTASLQPGNSGCPVLARHGRVVGVAIERRGDFGVLTRIAAVTALAAIEDPQPPRTPVRPSLGLHLRLAGLPAAAQERRSYGGVGFDIQVILLHRLLIAVRAHHGWLLSGSERRAGRPGRLREVMFQVGPSIPTPFDPREPLSAEIQPYGFVGAVDVGVGEVHETLQQADPGCDPAVEPCAYQRDEDAVWNDSLHPLLGGGIRMSLAAFMVGFEVGLAPDAPAETFRLVGFVGFRAGRM